MAGLTGCDIVGYDIHMGETTLCHGKETDSGNNVDAALVKASHSAQMAGIRDFMMLTDELTGETMTDGAFTENVYGTYVHGFFDAEGVLPALVQSFAVRRGIDLDQVEGLSLAAYREQQLDLLAAALREHLDMEYIYQIMGF